MDLPNLDLRSILTPTKPGMDLQKGVPGKEEEVRSQGSVFEEKLQKHEPRKANSSFHRNPETPSNQIPLNSKEVKRDLETDERPSEEPSSPMPPVAILGMGELNSEVPLIENDSMSEILGIQVEEKILQGTSDVEPNSLVAEENLPLQVESKELSAQTPESSSKLDLQVFHSSVRSKVEEEAEELDSSFVQNDVSAELMKEQESVHSLSKFDREDELAQHPGEQKHSEIPEGQSLKSFVDSLWIEESLKAAGAREFASIVSNESKVFKVAPEGQIRLQHLMEDIKPLISRVLATDQGGEMTIRLKPENLGWVKVDVQVEQDSVRLSFQAEQGMAKDMLKSQLSDLKQQLSVAGLQLQEVSVGLMKSEGSEHQKSGEFQRGHGQHQESGSSKKEKEAKDFEEWAYEESRGSQAA